jgi:hypothetical protein
MIARPYTLSCHCGAVRFEVDAELGAVSDCNCSTCARHGFLHWSVPKSAIRLLTWQIPLSVYAWRDIVEGHHFCPTCGVGIMRAGYPNDHVNVNARCIEGVDVFELNIGRYDGRHDMPPGPEQPGDIASGKLSKR